MRRCDACDPPLPYSSLFFPSSPLFYFLYKNKKTCVAASHSRTEHSKPFLFFIPRRPVITWNDNFTV